MHIKLCLRNSIGVLIKLSVADIKFCRHELTEVERMTTHTKFLICRLRCFWHTFHYQIIIIMFLVSHYQKYIFEAYRESNTNILKVILTYMYQS